MVTEMVLLVPVAPPVQPIQGDPAAGVAVKVTTVPGANEVPEGLVVTVPLPVVTMVNLYELAVVPPPPPPQPPPPPPVAAALVLMLTGTVANPPREFRTVARVGAVF